MMGSLSPMHWIIILVVAALVFGGRGKLSGLMGDAAKGIKAFREGLKEEDHTTPPPPAAAAPPLPPQPAAEAEDLKR
jgi:sec-independent protein translocase protein TatA